MFRLGGIIVTLICLVVAQDVRAQSRSGGLRSGIQKPMSNNYIAIEQYPVKSIIEIPWENAVSAAVFIKGNKLWVVFGSHKEFKYDRINLEQAKSVLADKIFWVEAITQLDLNSQNTFLVFDLARIPLKEPQISVIKKDFNWVVEIYDRKSASNQELKVVSKPLASPFPRVEIEVGEEIYNIDFTDPFLGDVMVVIPLANNGRAISKHYGFVDFDILSSAQGIAIQVLSDAVSYQNSQDKLYIGSPSMTISSKVLPAAKPVSPIKPIKLQKPLSEKKGILDLIPFKVKDEDFNYEIYKTTKELQGVSSKEKVKLYTDLALFYLANGFYREAGAIIKVIAVINENFADSYKIKLINAAINFMKDDYESAFDAVKSIDIYEVPIALRSEVRMWQGVLGYLTTQSNDYTINNSVVSLFTEMELNFLARYTIPLISKLGLVIIEAEIERNQPNVAERILEVMLKTKGMKQRDNNRLYYVAAKYYAKQNKLNLATEYLDRCIEDIADPWNRTLCRFEKVKVYINDSPNSLRHGIDELEKLTYIWRGDELEIEMLKYLGELYYKQKEYVHALRTWNKILKYFSESGEMLLIRNKMSDTFINFYLNKQDENLATIEALAIFYEFNDLAPIGEIGDEIVLKFTDYLIKLDLLDRATAILNHQVINRLTGLKREIVINKLAKLHILNHKSEIALDVLNLGDEKFLVTDDLKCERKYIRAEALYLTGRHANAIKLLKDDLSQAADDIKSKIYWSEENWQEFNNFSEPYLYSIMHKKTELTDDEVKRVLKQAVSYIMINRKDLLQGLYVNFKDRMPKKDVYTNVLKTLSEVLLIKPENGIIDMQEISNLKAMVDNIVNMDNSKR